MLECKVSGDLRSIKAIDKLFMTFPQHADTAISYAMKSEGHRLRTIMHNILSTGDGGEYVNWARLNPHTRIISKAKKGRTAMIQKSTHTKKVTGNTQTATPPLHNLKSGLRYIYNKESGSLKTGFLTPKTRNLAQKHASGYSVPVTPKMRKMAFALGFHLKTGTGSLKIPARPLAGPVLEAEKDNIFRNIETKFRSHIFRKIQEIN